jgi:hypothetical protein
MTVLLTKAFLIAPDRALGRGKISLCDRVTELGFQFAHPLTEIMIIRLGVRRNVIYLILQPKESGPHLLRQLDESSIHFIKSSIGRVKSSIGRVKSSIGRVKSNIDRINALLHFTDELKQRRYAWLSGSVSFVWKVLSRVVGHCILCYPHVNGVFPKAAARNLYITCQGPEFQHVR